jgi:lysophospholipase L1-like esterase
VSTRSTQWLKNLAVLAGSTLLCFAAAEVALRLISPVQTFVNPAGSFHQPDPELGWTGTPDLEARFRKVDFDVLVSSDASGFRARKSTVQVSPNSPVVAVLGDSFTWGWGVENGSVFTDVMQNALGVQADVRNFGMNAYGTLQELLLLKRLLKNGLQPRYVFVMFYGNDFYNNVDTDPWQPWLAVDGTNVVLRNFPVARRSVSRVKQLVKQSHLLSSIGYVFDFTKAKRRVKKLEGITFEDGAVAEGPRRAMAYCLKEFAAVCAEASIQLWFVYVPAFNDVQLEAASQNRETLRTLCAEQGVRLLDLTEHFRRGASGRPVTLYFPHDAHWNAEGHCLAGTVLADSLTKEMAAEARQK